MDPIIIDPKQGWHGAAGISDETLRFLLNLALSEMAIRSDDGEFEQSVAESSERFQSSKFVERLRKERDLMLFAAEVLRDIRNLPVALS